MPHNQGWPARQVRSVFLSDVHIGSRYSQSLELLRFLQHLHPRHVYIVGDLVDGWQLKRSFHWAPVYGHLLELLADMSAQGTQVFYLPGNHDAFVREDAFARQLLQQLDFVRIASEMIHVTPRGERFLVTHGDQFDYVEQSVPWLSVGVTGIYYTLLSANWWLSRLLGHESQSPYRLCVVIEDRVKAWIRLSRRFENALIEHARKQGCQGVICGHLHTPAIIHRDGMTYCNTGDWVENCTAVLEYDDGALELAHYYPRPGFSQSSRQGIPVPATEVAGSSRSLADTSSCSLVNGGSRG